jgi:translation elongation factor EF-Tu-like GTPase
LERGVLKKGAECEFVGYNKVMKSTVTGKKCNESGENITVGPVCIAM